MSAHDDLRELLRIVSTHGVGWVLKGLGMIGWHEVDFRREQKWLSYDRDDGSKCILGYRLVALPLGNRDERLIVATEWQPWETKTDRFNDQFWLPLEQKLFQELRARLASLEDASLASPDEALLAACDDLGHQQILDIHSVDRDLGNLLLARLEKRKKS